MTANTQQHQAIQKTLRDNPSMRWDGKIGFYSNGQINIRVYWEFDERKTIHHLTFNLDGTRKF